MKGKRRKSVCMLLVLLMILTLCPQYTMADTGSVTEEVTVIKPNDTDTDDVNYFTYTAYTGTSWVVSDSEAYIDLGTSDPNASECYYELTFYGSGVEIYANKSPLHSKITYTVDGEKAQTVDLYQATRSNAQSVYKISGLAEEQHTLKAVTLNEKTGSKIVNQIAYAKVTHLPYKGTPNLGGTIKDTNYQYTQDKYNAIAAEHTTEAELTAWKNDKATSELVLYSKKCSLENVSVSASDLVSGENRISSDHVNITFIKSTKAYNGSFLGGGNPNREVPADDGSNRSESSDILYTSGPVDISWNHLQPVWVEFDIPTDTPAGTYMCTLTAQADGIEVPLTFTYQICVQDAVLPDASEFVDSFDIELWQYPYSSAEYYGVEPFSKEHLEILKPIMEKYKEIGGHAITTSIVEEAWNGQTYSANKVHYPSMVKWTKEVDGTFSYDYTDFDKWVSFNKSLGIGDKIVLYSIAPWHNSFTYWDGDTLQYEPFSPGSARYTALWTDFLQDLIVHLEEKGWFDESYIGIDEQGFSNQAFDLVDSLKNSKGESLKTAGAMDSFVEKRALAMRVDDLNIGDTAASAHLTEFYQVLADRDSAGLKTTLYSCTGHIPGNFALSMPMESYWSIVNAGKLETSGFLRWSYDAWVADPLNDTTHNAFEPGDCFLIYPSEKDAEDKVVHSSVRLEKMAEGVRDVNKLKLIEQEVPSLASEIDALYAKVTTTAQSGHRYMTDAEKNILAQDMTAFKKGVAELTEKYIQRKNSGDTEENTGCVSYYSFENSDGKIVTDEWGNRDAKIQQGSLVKGKSGYALSVSKDQIGAVVEGAAVDSASWTVGYWVKVESLENRSSVMMTSDKNYSFDTSIAPTNLMTGVHVGTNTSDVLTFKYTLPVNTWVHMTWTQNKANGLSLYINGSFVQTNAWTKTNEFLCPADILGGTGFEGMLDELKIYDRVLTQKEIQESMVCSELTIRNTLPVYELDDSKLSVIDKDENNEKGRRYLGQPDMVMLDDNRTLITVYPVGHGHGELVMQISEDAGETWTEKTDIPSSWAYSLETPTLYKLHLSNGTTRLMLITALPNWGNGVTDAEGHIGGWNTSYSDDGGKTWTEYKNWHEKKANGQTNYTIVAMASLVQLKDENGNDIDKWMGVYHDADFVNYKTYLTFDENGNEQWSEPEPYLSEYRSIESTYQMCEIGMFRSPDGSRIVGLARSQSHNNPSTMIYSDDEGETWSKPMDLPGSLSGERHKAVYDPISGKLVVTFREIQFDINGNNQFDGADDWMAGDWVAWVGTYEDIIEQNDGEYRILLEEDWANNRYSGDTGYTGIVVLPDGTFIMDSYGHWDKEFSLNWKGADGKGYNVKTDLCYIKQAKFKLSNFGEKEQVNPFVDVQDGKYYYDAVLWAVDNGITNGRTETEFRPDEACTRAQVVTFLWRAAGSPEPNSTVNPFADVSAVKHKNFYKAILWAAEQKITQGYPDRTFQPEREVTRAEFVTFQYRANGSPVLANTENPFVDVTSSHKNFKNAILWAYQNNITKGKDATHFRPDIVCSRGDVVTFLYRAVAD